MKPNLLLTIAVVAILIAFVNFGVTLTKIADLKSAITGLAGNLGYVNVTINTRTGISFTNDTLNWGAGVVTTNGSGGCVTNTTLTTAVTSATVTCGNWSTTNVRSVTIENIGNVNVSLSLNSSQTASQLVGGSSYRAFQWNITTLKAIGSCTNNTGGGTTMSSYYTLSTWQDVNTTIGMIVCDVVGYNDAMDLISIDFLIRVPYDSLTGARGATITATAT